MPRKIGNGMNPRGNSTGDAAEQAEAVSLDSGQETGEMDPNRAEVGEEMEGAGGYNLAAIALQNLENEPEKPFVASTDLETMMQEGEGEKSFALEDLAEAYKQTMANRLQRLERMYPKGPLVGVENTGDVDLLPHETATNSDSGLVSVDEIVGSVNGLGLRPDGSYGFVVTVDEGMLEGVRQWAAEEGKTPERWLSEIVGNYLGEWSQPARSR